MEVVAAGLITALVWFTVDMGYRVLMRVASVLAEKEEHNEK